MTILDVENIPKEIQRTYRLLLAGLKKRGFEEQGKLSLSPVSNSAYFTVWHPDMRETLRRPTEIRISDHDLPLPNLRLVDILVGKDQSIANDAVAEHLLDMDAELGHFDDLDRLDTTTALEQAIASPELARDIAAARD